MNDPECLIDALYAIDAGAWVGKIEVHAEPQTLYGFQGDARPQKAHVIIRRKHISGLANDVGFAFKADGTCEAMISDYDRGRFNAGWVARLEKHAAAARIVQTSQAQGHHVRQQMLPTGEIRIAAVM